MGAAKNVALEPLPCAVGGAAFLHNVIIVHPRFCFEMGFSLCTIMPHYVTKLGEKKLLVQVAKRTCFCFKNCDSNFFLSVGKVVPFEM